MTRPTPLVHSSILAARLYYALRRAGHARYVAHRTAADIGRGGCNLRGLQAWLNVGAAV